MFATRCLPRLTAVGLLVLVACGADSVVETTITAEDPTTTTAPDGRTPPAGSGEDPATTAAPAVGSSIRVVETAAGSVLADGDGFALYIFTADGPGASTCTAACAELWPPITGDTDIDPGLDASLFTTITRDDGTGQLAVLGMPLYRYAGDAAPGDIAGQGFGDVWYLVDDEGQIVGGPSETPTTTVPAGYGY